MAAPTAGKILSEAALPHFDLAAGKDQRVPAREVQIANRPTVEQPSAVVRHDDISESVSDVRFGEEILRTP